MPATRRGPITDAEKRKIRALHKKGLGRNAIAKQAAVSLATVTKVCQEAGLTFDRRATAQAVEARRIDLAALRAEVRLDFLLRARHLNQRLAAPGGYTYRVVLKEDTEIVTDDEPPATDEAALGRAATGYALAESRLAAIDGDPGISKAASTITQLAAAFGIVDA